MKDFDWEIAMEGIKSKFNSLKWISNAIGFGTNVSRVFNGELNAKG